MNRKQRRAAAKRGSGKAGSAAAGFDIAPIGGTAELFSEASRCHRQGRLIEAQELCARILALDARHFNALNLLGVIAQSCGDHKVAIGMFGRAIAADPMNAACHYNLANSYQAQNRVEQAASHFRTAIELGMNDKAVEALIVQSPLLAGLVDHIAAKWPLVIGNDELFGPSGIDPIASDIFLRCALETTLIKNLAIEVVLMRARSELLRRVTTDRPAPRALSAILTDFLCALAHQCFINEYVFDYSDEEFRSAAALRDLLQQKLADGQEIDIGVLAAVAAYFPLNSVPHSERLLDWRTSGSALALLRRQVREPLEEAAGRATIPALTAITNDVSLRVKEQYEESPYPRWTVNPLAVFAADRLQGKTAAEADRDAKLDILIAGCGTGQHAVLTGQMYPNSTILAVDISSASLAYAQRRTREIGLQNIDYAQADILELASIHRRFDRIEAVGVLHHLADPHAGWRVLLSLLRPDGEMRVGLYSKIAREPIARARAFAAERGYRATPGDIRKFRSDVIRETDTSRWRPIINSRDFYSISGCRDLLFNVAEYGFSIPEIGTFLSENDLRFAGFDVGEDATVLERFQRQFPGADALLNLDNWHAFETSNPETFWGMYVFSVRKDG